MTITPCRELVKLTGIEVEILDVDHSGHIDLEQLESSLCTHKQKLVAIMAANNEIGTIHPIKEIAQIVRAAGAIFLCDITQAVGKSPLDVYADGIDIATFSAHKIKRGQVCLLIVLCGNL